MIVTEVNLNSHAMLSMIAFWNVFVVIWYPVFSEVAKMKVSASCIYFRRLCSSFGGFVIVGCISVGTGWTEHRWRTLNSSIVVALTISTQYERNQKHRYLESLFFNLRILIVSSRQSIRHETAWHCVIRVYRITKVKSTYERCS